MVNKLVKGINSEYPTFRLPLGLPPSLVTVVSGLAYFPPPGPSITSSEHSAHLPIGYRYIAFLRSSDRLHATRRQVRSRNDRLSLIARGLRPPFDPTSLQLFLSRCRVTITVWPIVTLFLTFALVAARPVVSVPRTHLSPWLTRSVLPTYRPEVRLGLAIHHLTANPRTPYKRP